MTITTTFDPPLPSDTPAVFDTKAFTLLGDLNDWSTEANALASDVNAKEASTLSAASTATTQAGIATTQASNALASANAAAASFDSFDDRYLGAKASNPTLDNDGNALLTGALYWNTAVGEMRAWSGSAWVTTSVANAVSRGGDTMTGPLAQAAGSAALPSYTFSGDTNTGMWSPGADILAWSTAGTERVRIDASGNVGIGTTSPGAALSIGDTSTTASRQIRLHGPASGTASGASVNVVNGTNTIFAAGNASNIIGGAYSSDAMLFWGNAALRFYGNSSELARIDASGNLLLTGSGGLGYGVGSGGTVTQTTNRSTGVVLNKPSGDITLVAATGSTAWESFNLTNSLIGVSDGVVVTQRSGTDLYEIHVTGKSAGLCRITFRTTGGTTPSDQPVFSFQVIKGATS